MKIVFMGTPDFAVPSLEMLAREGFDVAGVCTNPDRPAGRGKRAVAPPVKLTAQRLGLPVLQFEKIKSDEGVQALRALGADLFVTAAFGQILSQEVLDIAPLGCVNVHASLLPRYRGAAPIQWCIINGEETSGITTMYTDAGIDTGDIILQRETKIGEEETGGALFERLAQMGAEVLLETLRLIKKGQAPRRPQDEAHATKVKMIRKEMGEINWDAGSEAIRNLVRALDPWPAAYSYRQGALMKFYRFRPVSGFSGAPGTVLAADEKNGLVVATGDGALEACEIQAPGGRRMEARAYLRGKPIDVGARFTRKDEA